MRTTFAAPDSHGPSRPPLAGDALRSARLHVGGVHSKRRRTAMQRTTLGVIATSVLVLGSSARGTAAPATPPRARGDPPSFFIAERESGARIGVPIGAVVEFSGYLVSSGRNEANTPR